MSDEYSARQNKHPKIQTRQYLTNPHEPKDNISNNTPAELEAELLGNSFDNMRQQFRRRAQRMRHVH